MSELFAPLTIRSVTFPNRIGVSPMCQYSSDGGFSDEYGGTFDNRTRALREVTAAVRQVWPEVLPLFVRVSATDWAEGGWDIEQTVALARQLRLSGVDLVDCSAVNFCASRTGRSAQRASWGRRCRARSSTRGRPSDARRLPALSVLL